MGSEERTVHAAMKVEEIKAALSTVTSAAAENLPLTTVTLCTAWVGSPNVHRVTARASDDRLRRAAILHTIKLLARDTENAGRGQA
jgi:putative aminopeptidase FrvX